MQLAVRNFIMLIITNGDSAVGAIQAAGIVAEMLPWRDVLHDGPVPANMNLETLSEVRARYIAGCGWGEVDAVWQGFRTRDARLATFEDHEEVVLWFEHDLYDQLQLLQLLHWFSSQSLGRTQLSLICHARFIAVCTSEALKKHFDERTLVTQSQLELGVQGWKSFCGADPGGLVALCEADTSALPYLKPALIRLLEEYPDRQNGLSRSEQQILSLVDSGITQPGALFRAAQDLEEAAYLGDASFWLYIQGLMQGDQPLLVCRTGLPFRLPAPPFPDQAFNRQTLRLTEAGRRVMDGKVDWMHIHPVDKWLGGVHLNGRTPWRWDRTTRRLVGL